MYMLLRQSHGQTELETAKQAAVASADGYSIDWSIDANALQGPGKILLVSPLIICNGYSFSENDTDALS